MDCPTRPGRLSASADLPVLNNIFNADNVATIPKSVVRYRPSTFVTNQLPNSTPTNINAPHCFKSAASTLPFLRCERIELIDVGTIVASDVAVAMYIALCGLTPKDWKRKNNTGTITMPPPTPSSPASKPANIPVPTNAAIVGRLFNTSSIILFFVSLRCLSYSLSMGIFHPFRVINLMCVRQMHCHHFLGL